MEPRATHSKSGAQSNAVRKINMPKVAPKKATKAVKAKSKKADITKAQKAEGVSPTVAH